MFRRALAPRLRHATCFSLHHSANRREGNNPRLRPSQPTSHPDGQCPFRKQGERTMTTLIRPNLSVLRTLPTIHQVAEAWGKLELKLETEDTRYWLTTEGVARKTGGTPINYVIN